jgi:hypothetical protein
MCLDHIHQHMRCFSVFFLFLGDFLGGFGSQIIYQVLYKLYFHPPPPLLPPLPNPPPPPPFTRGHLPTPHLPPRPPLHTHPSLSRLLFPGKSVVPQNKKRDGLDAAPLSYPSHTPLIPLSYPSHTLSYPAHTPLIPLPLIPLPLIPLSYPKNPWHTLSYPLSYPSDTPDPQSCLKYQTKKPN